MASYNRVVLVGNLTRDIELRYIPSGMAVAEIGLAVNDRRKTANGEWIDEATFVDVTLWGRNAEVASEYLSKGSSILVEGRLKLDRWETDGQKRSKLRVVGEKMQMLGGKTGGGGESRRPPAQNAAQTAETQNNYSHAPSGESQGGGAPQDYNSNAGARDAQPTGGGAGYQDPDIPF